MGIFGWPSASFSAATPRRFSAVSCASKEATTMDSSDATWHQTCTYGSQSAIELPKTQNPHTCCSDCNSCWPQLTAYQRTTKPPSWNMVKPCENPSFRATGQSRNPCVTVQRSNCVHPFNLTLEAMTGFQTLLCLCWSPSGLEVKGKQNITTRVGQLHWDCCRKLVNPLA